MTQSQILINTHYSDIDITRFSQYYRDMKITISKDLNPLFDKLGLRNTVADKKFKVILTKGIIDGHFSYGDGLDLISMLLNDDFLIPSTIFQSNYVGRIDTILNPQIKNNKTFQSIREDIIDHNGKGVGKGEYFLLLFVKGYKIKTGDSDGICDGLSNQVKDSAGGSMKPSSISSRRVIDKLNEQYFSNTIPFTDEWSVIFNGLSDPFETLKTYMTQLHDSWDPSSDILPMVIDLITNKDDLNKMKIIYGSKVLNKYKEVDNFDCMTLISKDKIVIIRDFNNIPLNDILLSPVMKRGGDTQALADGYVNIKLK